MTVRATRRSSEQSSGRHHRPARRRGMRLVATLGLALASIVAIVTVQFPGAEGAYLAKITNSTNSAGSATYFNCTNAVSNTTAGAATFAYPFSDASGSNAADVSGSANPGTYSGTGITYKVASTACPRDPKLAITLDGSAGNIVAGTNPLVVVNNPQVFSLEIWFQTSTKQGKLIGFGNLRSGASAQYDRHLYINTAGQLVFGIYNGGYDTINSTASVADGAWHDAVATLSSAGMVLYVDGKLAASSATYTTAENHTGYWRIGYDNLSGWPAAPASAFFKGNLAWAAEYSYAMTAAQVTQHFVAGS